MSKTLTGSLILFISGCYVLGVLQPAIVDQFMIDSFAVKSGEYYRLITVALTHGGIFHLLFNMMAFYSLGTPIENFYGRTRYIIILIVSLLAGSISSVYLNQNPTYAVGASGMIFGLFGALVITGKRMGADYRSIMTLVGINLLLPFVISNIDWRAHVGGFIGGLIATLLIKPTHRGNIYYN